MNKPINLKRDDKVRVLGPESGQVRSGKVQWIVGLNARVVLEDGTAVGVFRDTGIDRTGKVRVEPE